MPQSVSYPPVTLANTEARRLTSTIVGQDYHVWVSYPAGYHNGNRSYPVVYLLDGDYFFDLVTGTVRFLQGPLLPESIVAGIGYGTQSEAAGNHRVRDYTPSAEADYAGSGGAANFLRFLCEELIPFMDANYRTNPSDRTLVGGSLGGLFTLYALLHAPGTWQRYVALSPSLRWSNRMLLQHEKEFAARRTDLPAKLFLSVGESEPPERMGIPVKEFAAALSSRNYAGLEMTFVIVAGATHLAAQVEALPKGLRAVFAVS